MRVILGFDPGLASAGWGLVAADGQRLRHIAHGCIRTTPEQPHGERLLAIYNAVRGLIDSHAPAEAAMEALFFGRNVTSALPVGEAKGVICLACAQAGVPLREFRPNEIKQTVVGVSRAEKEQVQEMVRLLLGLPDPPRPDHAADALAAAICAAHLATAI